MPWQTHWSDSVQRNITQQRKHTNNHTKSNKRYKEKKDTVKLIPDEAKEATDLQFELRLDLSWSGPTLPELMRKFLSPTIRLWTEFAEVRVTPADLKATETDPEAAAITAPVNFLTAEIEQEEEMMMNVARKEARNGFLYTTATVKMLFSFSIRFFGSSEVSEWRWKQSAHLRLWLCFFSFR